MGCEKRGKDIWKGLLASFEDVCDAMRKHQAQAKPSKIRFGFKTVEFWGWEFSEQGRSPARKNLCPIQKMRVPVSLTEHRTLMGLFNQFSAFLGPSEKDLLVMPEKLREMLTNEARTSGRAAPPKKRRKTSHAVPPQARVNSLDSTEREDELQDMPPAKRRYMQAKTRCRLKNLHRCRETRYP